MQLLYEALQELQLLDEGKAERDTLAKAVGQELSDKFWELKDKLKFKSPFNNFTYWVKQGPEALADFLENHKEKQTQSLQEQGYKKLYDRDGFKLFEVLSPDGMIGLGDNTSWCIAARTPDRQIGERANGRMHYNSYKKERGIDKWYVLFTPYADPLQKLCIAVDKNKNLIKDFEIYTQADDLLVVEDIKDRNTGEYLYEFVDINTFFSIPEVREVLEKYIKLPEDLSKRIYYWDMGIQKEVPRNVSNVIIIDSKENGVIPSCAFEHRGMLKSVKMPNSIIGIQNSAFYGCKKLTEVSLSENLEFISSYAFASTGLLDITIPDTVTEIWEGAFCYCKDLVNAKISNKIRVIFANTFRGCESLRLIEIPPSITHIHSDAFAECPSLKKIICYSKKLSDELKNTYPDIEIILK